MSFAAHRPDTPIPLLIGVAVLLGVPNGFNNLGNQLILHHASPPDAAGSASGLYRTAQYVGACTSSVVVAHALGAMTPNGGIIALGLWIGGIGGTLLLANAIALWRARRTER